MKTIEQQFVANFNSNPSGVIDELNQLVSLGYVKTNTHKVFPELTIYKYTQQTTFERYWNILTMACRGLVIDTKEKRIVALPFAKFFNLGELVATPLYRLSNLDTTQKFEAFDKMDGSLGIGFVHKNTFIWSTCGDFHSDQANFANKFMVNNYEKLELDALTFEYYGMTILAEIIYPDNRIVVDYGKKETLILLGIIRNSTGVEMSYRDLKVESSVLTLNVAERMHRSLSIQYYLEHREQWDKNKEGVVIKFECGKRLKIKGAEYLRVHKLRYGFSKKMQVELWKDGKLLDYLHELEEEFRPEVTTLNNDLTFLYIDIKQEVMKAFEQVRWASVSRAETAELLKHMNYSKLVKVCVFKILDKKQYDDYIKNYVYKNYRKLLKIGE